MSTTNQPSAPVIDFEAAYERAAMRLLVNEGCDCLVCEDARALLALRDQLAERDAEIDRLKAMIPTLPAQRPIWTPTENAKGSAQ